MFAAKSILCKSRVASFLLRRTILISSCQDIEIPKTNFSQYLLGNVPKFANQTAILDDVTSVNYTYNDVLQITKNISSGLVKHFNIKKGDVVSILLPNCPEFILSVLGVTSTGAAVTLINPIQPASNVVNQIEMTNSRIIITESSFLESVSEVLKRKNTVDAVYLIDKKVCGYRCFEEELVNDSGDCNVFGKVDINSMEDLCALPFSSGTTGLSKGVMLSHHNMVANLLQIKAVRDTEMGKDTFLVQLPIFHIYGLVAIAARGLRCGCKLITSPKFDGHKFLALLERHRITRLHLVPPQVLFLLNHKEFDQYDLTSIKDVSVGAAPIDEESQISLIQLFSKFNPDLDIYQGYGLTETLVISLTPRRVDRKPDKLKSVGQLVPNTRVKVLDPEGNELKAGEIGEILIQGPNVMKGYLNNVEATEKCIKDEWMHTGDLGYYDEDGYLYIEDRLKELIKFKGFQVPPAELEGILVSHPDIVQACVVGKPDLEAGELPFAFVKQTGKLTETEVKEYIAERVAPFKKLRGGVRFVNDIPCSASGKILRRELKKLLT